MWQDLKIKAAVKTYVMTGKFLFSSEDVPPGCVKEPLDAATAKKILSRAEEKGPLDAKIFGHWAAMQYAYFNYWSQISPEAAFVLSRARNIHIRLNGLKTITDECAELLGKAKGVGLQLKGLESLSDSAAASLGLIEFLHLENIEYLSEAAATSLSEHAGQRLTLNLFEIPEKVAAALGHCKKKELWLNYYLIDSERKIHDPLELSPEAAAGISHYEGNLYLGFQRITEEAMEQLSRFAGESLHLTDLPNLTENSARLLTKLPCEVHLGGLKTLPESVARILAGNNDRICVQEGFPLKLSDAVKNILYSRED